MNNFENIIIPKETPKSNQIPDVIKNISDATQNPKFLKFESSPKLIFDYQNYNSSLLNLKYRRNPDKKLYSIEKIIPQNKIDNFDIISPINDSQPAVKSQEDLFSIKSQIPEIKRNDFININHEHVTSTLDLNIKDIDLILDNENDNDQLYEFKKQLLEKEEEKNDNDTIEKLKALRAKYLPSSLEKDPSIVETNLNFNSTYTSFNNKEQNSLCTSSHGKTPLTTFSRTFANSTKNIQNYTNSNEFSKDNKSSSNCFKSTGNFRSFFDKLINDDNKLKNNILILKEKDNKIKQLMEENKRLNDELKELNLNYKALNEEYTKFKEDKDSENKETIKQLKEEKDNYKEYLIKENKELTKKNKKYDLLILPLVEYINEINNLLGFKKISILTIKQTIKSEKDTKIDNPFIGIITFLKFCMKKAHEILQKDKSSRNSNKEKNEMVNHKKRTAFSQKEIKNNFDFQSFAVLAKPKILDKYNVSVVKSKTLRREMKANNGKNGNVKNSRCSSSAKKKNGKKKRIDEETLGYWRGNTYVTVKI